MSRGIGEFGPIQELLPEWAAVLIALVTQLGDVWFLALLVGGFYWVHTTKREDAAVVIGLTLAGLSLITGLKHVFALPRPGQPLVELEALPWIIQPLYEATAMASGYGFPSGHALMTTIVYVTLARRLSIGTPRRRLLAAATVITLVCFSRVALGLHYLVDVVAGVATGLAFLFVAERLLERYSTEQGTTAFSLAVVVSAVAVLASDGDPDAVLLLGSALGVFGGWQCIQFGHDVFADDRPRSVARSLLLRGSLALVAFAPLIAALELFGLFSLPAAGGALGLALGVFITVPVLTHSERARRVARALSFWLAVAGAGVRYLLRPSTWRRGYAVGRQYAGRLRRWIRTQRAG
ncbi:phosphatase PAP2 family protein [Natronorubrum sulfidifaciens]|uniref:Phosphoesterase PA-phosphatase-like protein n=1 Tax=Natronorubrum sulfidifaciens JCM 14089 TaxID=1230460 RepID=L9WBS8_9EURY|nr:phosphatase PAP2 family protein [Natronorubrum sulfidifaciens]ELY46726.1 phosphoesterase PA-phosphatase-like protein [Natronorubrum sulfidifaciens JCM 14089]